MTENVAFSSEEEIKRELQKADGTTSGPLLHMDWEAGEPYVNGSESNGIFLGVTGCGKTRRGTIPMTMSMIQANESFLSVDPKGDIFTYTYALARMRGYHVKVFDFRDLTRSDGFDLFGYAYENYNSEDPSDKQMGIEIIRSIADCIYGDSESIHGQREPFWDNSAKSLFTAMMYMLFEHGTPDHIHPGALIKLANDCFERFGPYKYMDKMCDLFPDAPFVPLLGNVRSAPSDTLGSIKSCFYEPLNTFLTSKAITALMSDASFKMSDLDGKKKVAIYIILPDENKNYSTLASIILAQIFSHHIRIAHTMYGGRLPRRLNVVIEELGNIGGSLPMLDCLMTAGRSRNIRTFFVIQSFSQMDTLYGRSKAATILANADTLVAYRTNELATLRELSAKCGMKTDEDGDFVEPLVTPEQLGSLNNGEVLVLMSGRLKYITQLPDFTEIISLKSIPKAEHVPERGSIKTKKPALHAFVQEQCRLDKPAHVQTEKLFSAIEKDIPPQTKPLSADQKDIPPQTKPLSADQKDIPPQTKPSPADMKDRILTAYYFTPFPQALASEERFTAAKPKSMKEMLTDPSYRKSVSQELLQNLACALKNAADAKKAELEKEEAGRKVAAALRRAALAKDSPEVPQVKKKRGRPRKTPVEDVPKTERPEDPPVKRKRGRPRKTPVTDAPKKALPEVQKEAPPESPKKSSPETPKKDIPFIPAGSASYSVVFSIKDTPLEECDALFDLCVRHSVKSSALLPTFTEGAKITTFFKDQKSACLFSELVRTRFRSIRDVMIEQIKHAS